jgi:tRNA 2-selenouridine synthase
MKVAAYQPLRRKNATFGARFTMPDMPSHSVSAEEFLKLAETRLLLDVRSPAEYAHAHIPGAQSLPLFTDEERAAIGTAYKQRSQHEAIKIGLDAFGPRMREMVERVEAMMAGRPSEQEPGRVLLHCWRGGMRSAAVAWLLNLYGFDVVLLQGGYKAYRQWVIAHWNDRSAFRVLDGFTGAGKTDVLHALRDLGAPVLDLEDIAVHKGSAFGGLDGRPRPNQEMFENLLAGEMSALRRRFGSQPIWIENESQRIGDVNLPISLHRYWSGGELPTFFIDRPFGERLQSIVRDYGAYPAEPLAAAIVRIKKRLGPLETKTALAHLHEGNLEESFRILLRYYDKHYGSTKAQHRFEAAGMSAEAVAHLLQKQFS